MMSTFLLAGPPPPMPPKLWHAAHELSLNTGPRPSPPFARASWGSHSRVNNSLPSAALEQAHESWDAAAVCAGVADSSACAATKTQHTTVVANNATRDRSFREAAMIGSPARGGSTKRQHT